jgi:hypothetical protein
MRFFYWPAVALVALGIIALTQPARSTSTERLFSFAQQGVGAGAEKPHRMLHRRHQAAGLVQPVSLELTSGFTCEQIRIMDEVELITDDSYCN